MNKNNLKLPSNRKFGILFVFIFFFLSAYFYKNFLIMISFFLLATIFIIILIFNDNLLKPINILWMKIGHILGIIVSPIILSFLYFFIISPIAIVLKILKRDELNLSLDKKIQSHFKSRNNNNFSLNDFFKNQF